MVTHNSADYEIHIGGEVVDTVGASDLNLIGPGKECEEVLYSAEDPCAGPHHICQEVGEHDEHECFCGHTWGEDEMRDALELSRKEFTTFVRYQEAKKA